MQRNGYLINTYLKSYMMASIMTMAVLQINSTVDSIIMGRFIGPEALAAISVAAPVITIVGGVASLLAAGAIILIGKSFGARDTAKANQTAMTILISIVIAGILFALITQLFLEDIANTLCAGNSLYPLVRAYLGVITVGCIFLLLNTALEDLAEVGGNPQLVTRTSQINCVVNLALDVVLVGILGMDISGAAISTVMGSVVSVLWLYRYIKSDKSPYNLTLKGLPFMSCLKDNIKQGIPMLANSIAGVALVILLNYFVQVMQGESGMFVMSIVLIIMSIGLMLAGGSAMAFKSIGSMLLGRGDYQGARMLFSRCVAIALASTVLAIIIVTLFPEQVAYVFGADDTAYVAMAAQALPKAVWFIFALALFAILSIGYQMLEKMKLCSISIVSLPVFMGIGFIYVYAMNYYDYMWYVFPFAGFSSLAILLGLSEWERRRAASPLQLITLLPFETDDFYHINVSLNYDKAGVIAGIEELRGLCAQAKLEAGLTDTVIHCFEELALNIVQHAGKKPTQFFDAGLVIKKDEISLYLQDNGKAFNPIIVKDGEKKAGLKILNAFCKDISYQYAYGQNATFLKWELA